MKTYDPRLSLDSSAARSPLLASLAVPVSPYWIFLAFGLLLASVGLVLGSGSGRTETADFNAAAASVPVVYVDYRSTCSPPTGTADCPYPSLAQGCKRVASGGTVKIRPGPYALPLRVLTNSLTLESDGGPVLISASGLPGRPPEGVVWPSLTSVRNVSDDTFTCSFTAVPGRQYWIFTTTDLLTWSLWQDLVADSDLVELVRPECSSEPKRFFTLAVP